MEDTSGPEKNSVDLERTRASSWVVKGDQSVKVITWASYAFFNSIYPNLSASESHPNLYSLLKGALRCCHCGLGIGMWMFLILPTRHQHFLHSLEEDANSTASFQSPNQVHFLGQMVKANLPATFYLFGTFSEMWGSSPQSAWPGFNSWGKNWIVSSMTCDFEILGLALLATPCKQRNQMKLEGHIQDRVDQTVHHHPQTCIVATALVWQYDIFVPRLWAFQHGPRFTGSYKMLQTNDRQFAIHRSVPENFMSCKLILHWLGANSCTEGMTKCSLHVRQHFKACPVTIQKLTDKTDKTWSSMQHNQTNNEDKPCTSHVWFIVTIYWNWY